LLVFSMADDQMSERERAKRALLERLSKQPPLLSGVPWTRDELYDESCLSAD
jgi:hypothetical protein